MTNNITIKSVEQLLAIRTILACKNVDYLFLASVIINEEVSFTFDLPSFKLHKETYINEKNSECLSFSTTAEGELVRFDPATLELLDVTQDTPEPIAFYDEDNAPYSSLEAQQSAQNAFVKFCEKDLEPRVDHTDIQANYRNKNAIAYFACFGEAYFPLKFPAPLATLSA